MNFDLHPTLQNELVKIVPLKADDLEILYRVASDPLIWEQHPNKDRYKREVFENFFKGAIESGGAFLVHDAKTNEVIGSSRYYDFDKTKSEISIGYTFVAKKYWGKGFNPSLKKLMLNHAFRFVDHVIFHVGAKNLRSQMAMKNIGAKKIAEQDMNYYGEQKTLNFIFCIDKTDFIKESA
jgi:RimJ/RimL family protein N-acetyltransferase